MRAGATAARRRARVVRASSGTVADERRGHEHEGEQRRTGPSPVGRAAAASCREPKTMPPSIDPNAHRPRIDAGGAGGARLLGERDDRHLVAAEHAADAHRADDDQQAGRAAGARRRGIPPWRRRAGRPTACGSVRRWSGERDRAHEPDHRARDERQREAHLEGEEGRDQRADREDELVDDALEGEGAAQAVRVRRDRWPSGRAPSSRSPAAQRRPPRRREPGRRPGGRTRRRRRSRPGRCALMAAEPRAGVDAARPGRSSGC